MDSIQNLLAQRAEIDKKINSARREERSSAITRVRALMAEHGLTAADVAGKTAHNRVASGGRKSGAKSGSKVAVKYRNAATGDTWTGRGLQPKWLRAALAGGAKIADFLI